LTRTLITLGWWPSDEAVQQTFRSQKLRRTKGVIELAHPIALKARALSGKLEAIDLGCIFLHYQRHRGYLSTADLPVLLGFRMKASSTDETKDLSSDELTDEQKEIRNLNSAMDVTRNRLRGRTVSQFQLDLLEGKEPPDGKYPSIRARLSPQEPGSSKTGDPKTKFRYERWMYVEEFRRVWEKQAEFYPEMDEQLRQKIESLAFHQDPLESKEGQVGFCEILPSYRRCRQGELVFQRHRILGALANTKVDDRSLDAEEKRRALEFLLVREKSSYAQLKKAIGLSDDSRFDEEPLPDDTQRGDKKNRRKAKAVATDSVKGSKWGAQLDSILGVGGAALADGKHFDELVHDLISLSETARLDRLVRHYGIPEEDAFRLMTLAPPKGYAKRCSRVLRRIEPFLYQASNVYEAIHAAGYRAQEPPEPKPRLEVDWSWTTGNPSVDGAVRWSVKIINQIIDRYGKPSVIRVELPRQMAMGNEKRAEEWKRINENAARNKTLSDRLESDGFKVSLKNRRKMMLAEESGWRSPYEPDRVIGSTHDLIEYYDLDHIVPQSYSAEDGLSNLVLCPKALNQGKGNKTPFEHFGEDPERWAKITGFVTLCATMPAKKRERILAKTRPARKMEDRMLTQMGSVGTQITALLGSLGVDCQFVNGAITAEIRRRYGFETLLPKVESRPKNIAFGSCFETEKNREDLRHHAIDAATILLIDRSMAQRLTRYFQRLEDWKSRAIRSQFPEFALEEPFPDVRQKLDALLVKIPVVSPPIRRTKGSLHKEKMLPLDRFSDLTGPANRFEERDGRVVHFGPDGKVTGVWDKSTVHHGRLFEDAKGKRKLFSTSLFEVAGRLRENKKLRVSGLPTKPLIDKTPPEGMAKFVMSLSNKDTVEYVGQKGAGPGLYRVGAIAVTKPSEITLYPCNQARSDPKSPKSIRVRSIPELNNIRARVILNAFGEEIYSEPSPK
jgi:CRISPR-associated endonuclease Csn1